MNDNNHLDEIIRLEEKLERKSLLYKFFDDVANKCGDGYGFLIFFVVLLGLLIPSLTVLSIVGSIWPDPPEDPWQITNREGYQDIVNPEDKGDRLRMYYKHAVIYNTKTGVTKVVGIGQEPTQLKKELANK